MVNLYCQQDNTKTNFKKGDEKVQLKLKGKRVEKGYTQQEFAKLLGISTNSYNLKELGKREFCVSEINLILKLLNCNYEDIFLH